MVIKGMVGWDFGCNRDITVENCVIWCDWGGALEIGAETNADHFENITYKNCDLIRDSFGAMMRIHHHDRAEIHNVRYENIRCEYCTDQMMPVFQQSDSQVYVDSPGEYQPYIFNLFINADNLYGRDNKQGKIYDISFKDIHIYIENGATPSPQIAMLGVSPESSVRDISLENFYINGRRVEDIAQLCPDIGDFVYDISFK